MSAKALCFRAVRQPPSFVRSFGQTLLPRYLMNGLSNLDETYSEDSTAHTDDPIIFWRSKLNVTADGRVATASTSTLIEVYLLLWKNRFKGFLLKSFCLR